MRREKIHLAVAHPEQPQTYGPFVGKAVGGIPLQHLGVSAVLVAYVVEAEDIARAAGVAVGEVFSEHQEIHFFAAVEQGVGRHELQRRSEDAGSDQGSVFDAAHIALGVGLGRSLVRGHGLIHHELRVEVEAFREAVIELSVRDRVEDAAVVQVVVDEGRIEISQIEDSVLVHHVFGYREGQPLEDPEFQPMRHEQLEFGVGIFAGRSVRVEKDVEEIVFEGIGEGDESGEFLIVDVVVHDEVA